MIPVFSSPWGVAASREADNSLPSSADNKNEWSYTSILNMCTNSVYRDNFTVTLLTT